VRDGGLRHRCEEATLCRATSGEQEGPENQGYLVILSGAGGLGMEGPPDLLIRLGRASQAVASRRVLERHSAAPAAPARANPRPPT
jgi:hypothetical protein